MNPDNGRPLSSVKIPAAFVVVCLQVGGSAGGRERGVCGRGGQEGVLMKVVMLFCSSSLFFFFLVTGC